MLGQYNPSRADEESRYLALLNALTELDHEFVRQGLPDEAREMLAQLIGRCRLDYGSRFGWPVT